MYKFLIADSDIYVRGMIKAAAEAQGYKVTEAEDGNAAVQLCADQDFDIIVMDVRTPEKDGFSACKEIRKFKRTPFILISALCDEDKKMAGFEAGADDFMLKPLSVNVLMARIHAILHHPAARISS